MKKTIQQIIWGMIKIKLMCLIVLLGCSALSAEVWSQQKRFDLEFEQTTLIRFMESLQKKTSLKFIFNHEDVQDYVVDGIARNNTLEEVLNMALKELPFHYEILNDRIVVFRQEKTLPQVKEVKITGKVVDEKGESLPGVSILLKGTALGVVTDTEGAFSINVPESEAVVLVFSFIGMKSHEQKILENKTDYRIVLYPEVHTLDDVVVTGYTAKSKASFTGAAQTVSKEQLLSVGTKNILQSLQAFVPGMLLVENNAQGSNPNVRPEILVRGRSSFTEGANVPTFIVDGSEVSADYVFDMDINDVESATVLKDASASALYGAKAANGVIVITTKPMKGGKMKVSYNGNFSLTVPDLSDYHLLNAEDKLEYERLAGLYTSKSNAQQYQLDKDYNEIFQRIREGVNTDWMAYPLRNSFVNNHNLTIYGGDEYIRYNLGLRYGNDRGVMKGSDRQRYSLSFKLSYNKGDAVYLSNTMTISATTNHESPYGSFGSFVKQNPYDRAYNLDGSLNNDLHYNKENPLYEATLGSYNTGENFSLYDVLDFKFQLIEGLRLEGSFSLTKYKNNNEIFVSPDSKQFASSSVDEAGSIDIVNSRSMDYQGKLLLTYNKLFENGTLLSFVGGGNLQAANQNSNGYRGIGILSDKLAHPSFASKYPVSGSPSGSETIDRSVGGFLNANAIYKDRYFADFSLRYEGSSKFGADERFAPFWSAGVGWNIHKEKFFAAHSTDRLKVRASIGYLGNASFPAYMAVTTYQYQADLIYDKGIGAIPMAIANPDLKWERTLNYNAGLDINLFHNRLDLTFDYYKRITDNLLLDVTKAPSVGVTTAKENLGKVDNTGVELRTRVIVIRNKDWDWTLSLTATHNANKIKKISNALKAENEKQNADKSRTPRPLYEEGESMSAVKVVKSGGIDPATGREIYIGRDGKPTFTYDYKDKIVYGDSDPKLYGVFSSYLTYKGVSLNMMFDYKLKSTIYNQTLVTRVEGANPRDNADQRVFDSRWKETGDYVKYKNIADNSVPEQTSRFIEDEYTLNMRSLSLAYDFPEAISRRLYLSRLRLEFMTNDLFRVSTVKQERGFDYPFARSFQLNISATF